MEGSTTASGAISTTQQPTAMQSLMAELESSTSIARANLSAVVSQRQRLMGDLPPEPPTAQPAADKLSGGSVSFNDVAGALDRLRGVLQATNEHVLSMRKIG